MTQPRAALYARVSTVDQNCELQLKELREYVARQGWQVVAEYIDNISGAKASRPALDRLMEAAVHREFDVVLVCKLDRFGRSVLHLSQHLSELERHKVRFLSISQGLDTDARNPASRLLLGILAAIAEFERELIRERTIAGRDVKLSQGKPDSWNLGYGFSVEGDAPRIIEKEAEVLNQMFHWRREGKSFYAIAGLLQSRGVKPRKAGFWSPATIRGMLQNRCYVGEFERCGRVWAVPQIIPHDLFDDVQREMRAVHQRLVGRPSSKYLLRGLLFCRCLRRMHGTECNTGSGGKWRHYRCDGKHHRNPSLPAPCDAPRLSARVIEELVWRHIWLLLRDPARVRRLAEAMAAEEKRARKGGLKNDSVRQLEVLRRREGKVLEMTEAGVYTTAVCMGRITAIRKKIAELEMEVRTDGRVVEIAPLDDVERACRAIAAGPEPEGYEDRREVLEALLDLQARVDGEEVAITGKIPVPAAPQKNCKDRLLAAGGELSGGHLGFLSGSGPRPVLV